MRSRKASIIPGSVASGSTIGQPARPEHRLGVGGLQHVARGSPRHRPCPRRPGSDRWWAGARRVRGASREALSLPQKEGALQAPGRARPGPPRPQVGHDRHPVHPVRATAPTVSSPIPRWPPPGAGSLHLAPEPLQPEHRSRHLLRPGGEDRPEPDVARPRRRRLAGSRRPADRDPQTGPGRAAAAPPTGEGRRRRQCTPSAPRGAPSPPGRSPGPPRPPPSARHRLRAPPSHAARPTARLHRTCATRTPARASTRACSASVRSARAPSSTAAYSPLGKRHGRSRDVLSLERVVTTGGPPVKFARHGRASRPEEHRQAHRSPGT
jgi:hypothetical protein